VLLFRSQRLVHTWKDDRCVTFVARAFDRPVRE
jgi:hypothetical protein